MKKNAFTLVELLITILISSALAFAMIWQFVALDKFNNMVIYTFTFQGGRPTEWSRPVAEREARIVIHQMSNVLRFAKPLSFSFIDNGNENRISFTVEGGHIAAFPADTSCYFRLDKSPDAYSNPRNILYFYDGTQETVISGSEWVEGEIKDFLYSCVVSFCTDNTIWDDNTKMLTLKLIFSYGATTIPIETAIKVLGGG